MLILRLVNIFQCFIGSPTSVSNPCLDFSAEDQERKVMIEIYQEEDKVNVDK